MIIQIVSSYALLAAAIARRIALTPGVTKVDIKAEQTDLYALVHGPMASADQVGEVLGTLEPLEPQCIYEDATDADVVLHLGDEMGLDYLDLRIHSRSRGLAERVSEQCRRIGFDVMPPEVGPFERNEMRYGGASDLAREVVRWICAEAVAELRDLAKSGDPGSDASTAQAAPTVARDRRTATATPLSIVEQQAWDESDNDLWVYLSASDLVDHVQELIPVVVTSDDSQVADTVMGQLQSRGFDLCRVEPLTPIQATDSRFSLRLGEYGLMGGRAALALQEVATSVYRSLDVDSAQYPLEVHTGAPAPLSDIAELEQELLEAAAREGLGSHAEPARLFLPAATYRQGDLRPYAGPAPERFDVELWQDHPDAAQFALELETMGFANVRVHTLPPHHKGSRIRWNGMRDAPKRMRELHTVLSRQLPQLGAPSGYTLPEEDGDLSVNTLEIFLSQMSLRGDASAEQLIETCQHYKFRLLHNGTPPHQSLLDELRLLQPSELSTSEIDSDDLAENARQVKYGAAPSEVVDLICDLLERHTGIEPEPQKTWGEDDRDVFIYLGNELGEQRGNFQTEGSLDDDTSAWLADDDGVVDDRCFFEMGDGLVRLGDVELTAINKANGTSSAAATDLLRHFTWDQVTCETVLHVARCAAHGLPCLLEGPTAVSKTAACELLATLTGNELYRINLSQQTDTADVIGRYVPRTTSSRDDACAPAWAFQLGLIPTAMLKPRRWVLLDEINLATSGILERLAPVLELSPSLVLTEHDNQIIGRGNQPVHPDFRLFACMNPVSYAGRSELSPAFRDRWQGYRLITKGPSEEEYIAMLKRLVFGYQPNVLVDGRIWVGWTDEPRFPRLADVPGMEAFLEALGRFHACLATGDSDPGEGLGAQRRERYVFSRRTLLTLMSFLDKQRRTQPSTDPTRQYRAALDFCYLQRVEAGDRGTLCRLLDAAGIGPQTWSITVHPGSVLYDEETANASRSADDPTATGAGDSAPDQASDGLDGDTASVWLVTVSPEVQQRVARKLQRLTGMGRKRSRLLVADAPTEVVPSVDQRVARFVARELRRAGAETMIR